MTQDLVIKGKFCSVDVILTCPWRGRVLLLIGRPLIQEAPYKGSQFSHKHADSDSADLGWGLRFCISRKLLGDAAAAAARDHTFESERAPNAAGIAGEVFGQDGQASCLPLEPTGSKCNWVVPTLVPK